MIRILLIYIYCTASIAQCGRILPFLLQDHLDLCDNLAPLDISGLKIIQTNDLKFYINGTNVFKKPIPQPTKLVIDTKRFIRGQWVPGDYRRIVFVVCAAFERLGEPWYLYFQQYNGTVCPLYYPRTEKINMLKINTDAFLVPPNCLGRWSATAKGYSNNTEIICLEVHFELREVTTKVDTLPNPLSQQKLY